jgi:hypothetical protein
MILGTPCRNSIPIHWDFDSLAEVPAMKQAPRIATSDLVQRKKVAGESPASV